MIKFKTVFKNITCFVMAVTLITGICVSAQNSCIAEEAAATQQYEKITKKYPSMEQYIAQSRKMIKENWYPSSASFEHSATIVLKISKDGTLLDSYISSSSNNLSFDESLIEAAQKTKFAPLPDDVNEECVDIDMLFKMQRRNIFLKK